MVGTKLFRYNIFYQIPLPVKQQRNEQSKEAFKWKQSTAKTPGYAEQAEYFPMM